MEKIRAYIEEHKERFLEELLDLLRVPSVSADPNFKPDVLKAAEIVKSRLVEAGVDHAEVCQTPGYPIVYAEKIIDSQVYLPYWYTAITTFSLLIRLNCGLAVLLSPL